MGSTVVALLSRGTRYAILWVGDSRAYLIRGGTLTQLSRDHSQVQEMVARGLMKPEQASATRWPHIVARGRRPGRGRGRRVDGELQAATSLLSSDGLHGVVGDGEIAGHLARSGPDEALGQLVELTLAKGAPDNVTAIAIWVSEPTLLSFADPKS